MKRQVRHLDAVGSLKPKVLKPRPGDARPKPKRQRVLSQNLMKPLVHGRQGYLRGCDCEVCHAGHAEYMRAYREKKRPTEQERKERLRKERELPREDWW